jgi:hypothetical protein
MKPRPERVHELASRLMDGSLTPTEERELGEALRGSAEAREVMLSYFRLEGAIAELARVQLVSQSGVCGSGSGTWKRRRSGVRPQHPGSPALPRRAAWGTGLVAAAALLGLLYVAARGTAPSPSPAIGSAAKSPSPERDSTAFVPSHAEETPPSPDARLSPAPTRPEVPVDAVPPQPESQPAPTPSATAPSSAPSGTPPSLPPEPKDPPAVAETVVTEVTVERVEGEVFLTGRGAPKGARPGDLIPQGLGLETGPGRSLAVLTFPDGTRLEARSETSIRDIRLGAGPSAMPADARGGKSLFLQRGSVWAHVRPQPADRPFVMGTPRGEARILGTILTLRVDPDPKGAVRLDVQEGKVRFSRSQDARSVDVPAGHSVSSTAGSDLALLRSTEVLTSFQDGAAPTPDYAGTRDTFISEKNSQSNFGRAKSLVAEGEDVRGKHKAQWLLLRWDLSAVPPGSRVRSASISLYVTAPSQGSPFYLYEPARAWSEGEATWKLAAAGSPWRFPGSLGAVDRWGPPAGTLVPLVKGEYTFVLNETGVALVQSWVNAPTSNLGFVMASPDPAAGLHINSREAQPSETRPKLSVVYLPHR